MFKNYFTVAMRNLIRHKVYSTINILGLAVGIALCILIFLFVRYEWRYDAFHQNGDRIYRVLSTYKGDDGSLSWSSARAPLGPLLKATFPEIERAVRFFRWQRSRVTRGDQTFRASVTLVDPDVFHMFSFPLAQGDPDRALRDEHSVVISQEMARKYFGDEDPIGKTLVIHT